MPAGKRGEGPGDCDKDHQQGDGEPYQHRPEFVFCSLPPFSQGRPDSDHYDGANHQRYMYYPEKTQFPGFKAGEI